MRNTRRLYAAVAVVAVLLVAFGAWFFVIRSDAPSEASLDSALSSISTPSTGGSTPATGASTPSTGGSTPAAATPGATGVNGKWSPDTTKPNFLGYRVGENLVGVGTTTAVGRTSAVTGEITVAGNKVTAAKITGDLTKLASDKAMRDNQLRNQAIETSKFPNAVFELSEAVTLPDAFARGDILTTTLKGKLTLHGVTKDVSVPVEGKMQDGLMVVVGSIDILFADYNIGKPQGASVLSIDDHGLMELQLFLKLS